MLDAEQAVENADMGEELDPENEQQNDEAEQELVKEGDSDAEFDYDKLTADTSPAPMDRLFKRVEVWDTDLLMAKTRELDEDQLFVVNILVHYEAACCYPFTRNEELQNNKSIVVLYYVSWAA